MLNNRVSQPVCASSEHITTGSCEQPHGSPSTALPLVFASTCLLLGEPAQATNTWVSNVITAPLLPCHLVVHISPWLLFCAFCHIASVPFLISRVLWSLRKVPPASGTRIYASVEFGVSHPLILQVMVFMLPLLCATSVLCTVRFQLFSEHLSCVSCVLTLLLLVLWVPGPVLLYPFSHSVLTEWGPQYINIADEGTVA